MVVCPNPIDAEDCRLGICVCCCPQEMSDTIRARSGGQRILERRTLPSKSLTNCFANVRATSRRKVHPVAMPLTPPSAFMSAVSLADINALEMVCGTRA